MVSKKKKIFKKYIQPNILSWSHQFYFINIIIIVILQKPNVFTFNMSKRLDFSQVSVLLSAPDLAVHYGKRGTGNIHRSSTVTWAKMMKNWEAFWKLQNIAVYCLYVTLAGDFRMLPGKWKNLNSLLFCS